MKKSNGEDFDLLSGLLFVGVHYLGHCHILIDPVTKYVIANPLFIFRRLIFAWWYMFWTTPRLVYYFTDVFPKTSIKFYSNLMKQYLDIFGEDIAKG